MVCHWGNWALVLGLVVGMASGIVCAQQTPPLSASVSAAEPTVSGPEPATSSAPQPLVSSSRSAILPSVSNERHVADRQFWALVAFTAGSAVLDGESTVRALQTPGRRELNPMLGSHPDRVRFYATVGLSDAALTYLAYRLKRSGHDKLWRIPLVGVGTAHLGGAINNLRY